MKATELMIGDWVQFADGNKKCVVVGIKCDARYLEKEATLTLMDKSGRWFEKQLEEIKPVSLTKEILEKNGFVTTERGCTSWRYETKREDLIDIYGVNEYHLSINIEDTHGSGKGYRWMLNNFVIFYVHQLQNSLRNFGINKEIAL